MLAIFTKFVTIQFSVFLLKIWKAQFLAKTKIFAVFRPFTLNVLLKSSVKNLPPYSPVFGPYRTFSSFLPSSSPRVIPARRQAGPAHRQACLEPSYPVVKPLSRVTQCPRQLVTPAVKKWIDVLRENTYDAIISYHEFHFFYKTRTSKYIQSVTFYSDN